MLGFVKGNKMNDMPNDGRKQSSVSAEENNPSAQICHLKKTNELTERK